ncbi:hypothetical protein B296_00012713 [Ensete ventricosum]|uniref:Uncharacterized protein n=1 Tax=Ensete ventricosum TaxID=4639 RepID=A0A426YH16_ENSVE|nr:hypothetical protein B296_00012713 [Ensete ventricosum]
MQKVFVEKPTQAAQVVASSPEVEEVPMEVVLRTASTLTLKRPAEGSTSCHEDSAQAHKRVKVIVGKHKSRHDEGSSRAHSKDKEPVAPSGELAPSSYHQSK